MGCQAGRNLKVCAEKARRWARSHGLPGACGPLWITTLLLHGSGMPCHLAGMGVFLPSVSMKEGRVGQQSRLLGSKGQRPPGHLAGSSTQGKDSSPGPGSVHSLIGSPLPPLPPPQARPPGVSRQSSRSNTGSFPALVNLSRARRSRISPSLCY